MQLEPTDPIELITRLRQGPVTFAFKKLNGSLRTAIGTLNLATIPPNHHPKGVRAASPKLVTFFDLEKQEWRSVSKTQEMFIF